MTSGALAEKESSARADAFRQLADRHLESSYRLALVIMGQPADAQDAVQEAFVLAWRKWGTLRDQAKFERWFDRILVNTCRSRMRSASRWQTQDLSEDLALARESYGDVIERDVLFQAMRRLSADHRVVVGLRFYRDLTVEDIAKRTGARPGTVKSRLHHALRQLRELMSEAGYEEMES
ncbi:MAG TPA: sigma-70 family RNA polymerase sigma factor [Candidatus Limnocylindria bacterium]|nr:sigma-70 family RNA polymerase sigma factor [Candidatus Limnocylindria bacterium]